VFRRTKRVARFCADQRIMAPSVTAARHEIRSATPHHWKLASSR
jgi:hypothetical protein